jgi:hypothetical protein
LFSSRAENFWQNSTSRDFYFLLIFLNFFSFSAENRQDFWEFISEDCSAFPSAAIKSLVTIINLIANAAEASNFLKRLVNVVMAWRNHSARAFTCQIEFINGHRASLAANSSLMCPSCFEFTILSQHCEHHIRNTRLSPLVKFHTRAPQKFMIFLISIGEIAKICLCQKYDSLVSRKIFNLFFLLRTVYGEDESNNSINSDFFSQFIIGSAA